MSGTESMIGDAVARMFEGASAPGSGFDAALWDTVSQAGVPRLLRPESEGGAGNAQRDAVAVLQAAGQHAAALPLADALVAHALLSRAGLDAPDEGPIQLLVASPDGAPDVAVDCWDTGLPASAAHRLTLHPWGQTVRGEWLPKGGQSVSFELSEVIEVQGLLALAGAAAITGAMRRAFDMTLEWAGTRVQFGRPIGQFQAVQHALAIAAEEIAASRAALDWAAAEAEAGRPMPSAAIAKARAAEAAGKVTAIAHQAHGAIGFTAEYALFRHTRLMWQWRDRWGDERHWQAVLGRAALAAGPDGLFDLILGESFAYRPTGV
jgi:acyl-CoA dehydrogenase